MIEIEVVLLTILSNDSARIPRVEEASASAFVGFTIVATTATTVRMVEKRVMMRMMMMEEACNCKTASSKVLACYWMEWSLNNDRVVLETKAHPLSKCGVLDLCPFCE